MTTVPFVICGTRGRSRTFNAICRGDLNPLLSGGKVARVSVTVARSQARNEEQIEMKSR
jgi:non-ribosomal peptide synthetase component F